MNDLEVQSSVPAAQAGASQGHLGMTSDLGRPVFAKPERATRLAACSGRQGSQTFSPEEKACAPAQFLTRGAPPYRIGFLTKLTGLAFAEA